MVRLSLAGGRCSRPPQSISWSPNNRRSEKDHTADNPLHSDYINPIDLCNRLNTYIVPEAGVHAFLTILFLLNGYWIALLLNVPLLAFNAKKYVSSTIC